MSTKYAALVVLLVAACSREPGDRPIQRRPVKTMVVQSSGGARARTFSGVAEASQQFRLSFRIPGTVERVAVKVGDSVKQGADIAHLDSTDYELQVEQARAAKASADAQTRDARAKYTQVQALFESRSSSKRDLDSARALFETARANASAAGKQVALARQQLRYTRLTAPADGSIASVLVEDNENVDAGRPVALLTAGTRREVNIAVPSHLIAGVEAEAPVKVRFDAVPGKVFSAAVSEIGVVASETGATYPVTVLLEEGANEVRPGLAAEVTINFGSNSTEPRYLVPPHAVGEDADGRFVFAVERRAEEVGVVRRTAVAVGDLGAEGLEVTRGVSDGMVIVTAGVSRIQDGLEVRLPPNSASAME